VSPTGEIFVTGSLDREARQTFHMTLEGRDSGGLRDTTLLVVTLLDINDQSPVFRPNTYLLILEENRGYTNALQVFVSATICKMYVCVYNCTVHWYIHGVHMQSTCNCNPQATDLDEAGTVNTMIDYSISPDTLFMINSVNGIIGTAQNLDCETTGTSHSLTVTATDRGVTPGPLSGTAVITVSVQVSSITQHPLPLRL